MSTEKRPDYHQRTPGGAESGTPPLKGKVARGGGPWSRHVVRASTGLALFATLFLAIAALVSSGRIPEFDHTLLEAFRRSADPGQVIGPRAFSTLMRQLTDLGSASVMLLLSALVAGYLLLRRQWLHAVQILVATGGGAGLGWVAKHLIQRPRPTVVPMLGEVHSWSFPSGHATMSAVVYLTLGILVARYSHTRLQKVYVMSAAILLPLVIGLSRLVMGVHFPTDVLAGWMLGLSWACLVWLGCHLWETRSSAPTE